jgi:hypothetical protein
MVTTSTMERISPKALKASGAQERIPVAQAGKGPKFGKVTVKSGPSETSLIDACAGTRRLPGRMASPINAPGPNYIHPVPESRWPPMQATAAPGIASRLHSTLLRMRNR